MGAFPQRTCKSRKSFVSDEKSLPVPGTGERFGALQIERLAVDFPDRAICNGTRRATPIPAAAALAWRPFANLVHWAQRLR
jgi:hypothetical protein